MPEPESIVIVGAGLAGGNAAVTLRDEGYRGRLVVVGREPGIPFGRPPLSKTYLRGEETLDGWYVRPTAWYADNDVELLTGAVAEHLDTAEQRALLADGTRLPYDRLAMCSGGRARRPNIPGIDLEGVHVLRTVAD